ncbi:guanitoxin biosynthesis L-enduracididine beta-hydroxylase GntD [Actinophytocola sp.]|uniref:guanitoxin biosynthesis L-enduracididine beta-hydroxylase GntD n=1 Tax=Actinophytocola sp. TaxID=1872138 RepID=UPI003D6BFB8B
MHKLTLSRDESGDIQQLLGHLAERHRSVEDPELLDRAGVYLQDLPVRLRGFLEEFRLAEPSAVCLISGYPVRDGGIGPTPEHWKIRQGVSPTLHEELFFMLCARGLGDVFGWSTQQDGRIMHDVLPIKGHEQEQLGSGSEQLLWWHTEDAFHPFKGDYVALMCLRNPDLVGTTICAVEDIDWAELDVDVLFEPHYYIRPDESHLPKNRLDRPPADAETERLLSAAYQRITEMNANPAPVPILRGDRRTPYMCLDPYFMDTDRMEPEPRKAFEALTAAIDASLHTVALAPGDCVFVDNFKAVHGRLPFKARFDGTDRWLKRLNITRNLRGSREARLASHARVIF